MFLQDRCAGVQYSRMYLKLKSQMSLINFDAFAFEENVPSSGKISLASMFVEQLTQI